MRKRKKYLFKFQRKWLIIPKFMPRAAFNNNMRTTLPKHMWGVISATVIADNDYMCAACRGEAKHTHEEWDFVAAIATQRLVALVPMCILCHLATHLGYAQYTNQYDIAIAHLRRINKYSKSDLEDYIKVAQHRMDLLGGIPAWHLDIAVAKPNVAEARRFLRNMARLRLSYDGA